MQNNPINDETGAALARFFYGGRGPSHTDISNAIGLAGLGSFDDYKPPAAGRQGPNKQRRVLDICKIAKTRPESGRKLAQKILEALRLDGVFKDPANGRDITSLREALAHVGWALTDDGRLEAVGAIDLDTGGRAALDEQLARLRRTIDDPAAALGSAKELLEAVMKFVIEDGGLPLTGKEDFPHLIAVSFERLRFQTKKIDESIPGARALRSIHQSARTVISSINELRNQQGTGHGRTLPTALSNEDAVYVVREATHVAELMLTTHDRQMSGGRLRS